MGGHRILAGCACAVSCETLFGLSYLFTKDALAGASELALLGWRFLAGVIAMAFCAAFGIVKVKLRGRKLGLLFSIALFSPVLYFIGETFGIGRTSASESGAFLACIPVAALSASSIYLKKKPSRIQVIGILVTLCGVLATLAAASARPSFSPFGYAMLLLAVASYAMYSVLVEKAEDCSSAEITFAMLLAGALAFVPAAIAQALMSGGIRHLASLPFDDTRFLAACLYQGIGCSVVAFFLSNAAIARIGVNRAASFLGVSTAVAVLSGVLILGEQFTSWQCAGVALILSGVLIANSTVKA